MRVSYIFILQYFIIEIVIKMNVFFFFIFHADDAVLRGVYGVYARVCTCVYVCVC